LTRIEGRVWLFGDEINTDVMAPGIYFKEPMDVAARHCLEAIDPELAINVQPGDIVVGGRNFGVGSAREQAAMAFRELKVGALLAISFARIFYRNAVNLGVPALTIPDNAVISAGDTVAVDPTTGKIENMTTKQTYSVAPIPDHLMEMIQVGGLMPHLKQRLAKQDRV